MRDHEEILRELNERMPHASHERLFLETFREWLDLPEGFSFRDAYDRIEALKMDAGAVK